MKSASVLFAASCSIRRSWGNAAGAVSQAEAARLRGIPAD
jgi:hypothetical protein